MNAARRAFLKLLELLPAPLAIPRAESAAIPEPPPVPPIPEPPVTTSPIDINQLLAGMVDRRHDGLYHRVFLRANEPTPHKIRCFNQALGTVDQHGRMWTEIDTNMRMANQLPAPFDGVISRILFLFQPSVTAQDISRILQRYAFEFRIMQKVFLSGPCLWCSATRDVGSVFENFTEGKRESKLERIGKEAAFEFARGSYLPSLTYFAMDLESESSFSPDADIEFYVILDGIFNYPAQ